MSCSQQPVCFKPVHLIEIRYYATKSRNKLTDHTAKNSTI